MASYRLNIARIRGCPSPAKVAAAMEAFGLPEDQEFGVLNQSAADTTVFGTIIRRTQSALPQVNPKSREVTSSAVERVSVYPFGIRPSSEALETYAGSASSIEQVGAFLSGSLGLPVVVESVELDIAEAMDKLVKLTQKLALRSLRVSEYAHNSYMSGPYTPKFMDSEHGRDFLREYARFATAASVRFAMPAGRATVRLAAQACFSFSCNEEDRHGVQAILRKLA